MRRVLFIAYLFPPIANSGTRRSLCFANHLPAQGWDPLVLTVEHEPQWSVDQTLLEEVKEGIQIERVMLGSRLRARSLTSLVPGRWRERVIDALAWRMQMRSDVPDEAESWLEPAVARGVAMFEQHGFDVIYASGWPWTAFLVAREVAARTGRPFILDYRDQWTPSGDHKWEQQSAKQARANPALEHLAAKDAAAVITVTRTLVESIARDCGRTGLHLITNGFEPADFANSNSRPDDGLVRVAYTGVWRDGYGLQDLYKALAQLKADGAAELKQLRVEVAGFKTGPAIDFGIDDIVTELGAVPHSHAVELMTRANLLYLPVPEGFYAKASLPGKLFEYLGCGGAIMAVVPADSEVARVLNEVGGGLRIEPGHPEEIAKVLVGLVRGQSTISAARPELVARYTRSATTAKLAKILAAAADGIVLEPMQ